VKTPAPKWAIRLSRKKNRKAAKKKQEPEPEEPEEDEVDEDEDEAPETEYELNDLKKLLTRLSKVSGDTRAPKLFLKDHGKAKLSDVEEDEIDSMCLAVEALIAKHED
jgi:hypothetical protein